MLNAVIIAAILLLGQNAERTGIIAGSVIASPSEHISKPIQVILLPPRYSDLWNSEVQKRLDMYWQQFQPTFRSRKELFTEFSRQAHRDATNYVVTRMRRDTAGNISPYLLETSVDGKFEFKNIPFGEYKVLALGKIGNQDVIWQEFVDIRSNIPHFLELNKRVP